MRTISKMASATWCQTSLLRHKQHRPPQLRCLVPNSIKRSIQYPAFQLLRQEVVSNSSWMIRRQNRGLLNSNWRTGSYLMHTIATWRKQLLTLTTPSRRWYLLEIISCKDKAGNGQHREVEMLKQVKWRKRASWARLQGTTSHCSWVPKPWGWTRPRLAKGRRGHSGLQIQSLPPKIGNKVTP